MNWLIGAVLGGIVGLIAQTVALSVSKRYKDLTQRTMRRLRFKWGRADHATLSISPRPASVLPQYFNEAGAKELDIAIYELSLRPLVPLMDLLYFEYLKTRLSQDSIKRVLIFPWSGNRNDTDLQQTEQTLEANLKRIFGSRWKSVDMITAAELATLSEDLLDNDFMRSLEALGDSKFLAECSKAMGYRFKSYADINSGHPPSMQARSLVEHAIRGWLIYKYLEGSVLDHTSDAALAIGSLVWERELSKLLVLRNLQRSERSIRIGLMLGKSVTFREGMRQAPLPTYDSAALEVFGPVDSLIQRCTKKGGAELSITHDVVTSILNANNCHAGRPSPRARRCC